MNEAQQTLVSLAILKADLDDERRDYLSYLESFVVPILKEWKEDTVTDAGIAAEVLREYGLKVPNRAVQLVLRRLARRKYLKREHGVFEIISSLPETDIPKKRVEAERHIDAVHAELKQFANEKFGLTWGESETNEALLAFLDNFGVDCLKAYVFRTALPQMPEALPKHQYVVGSFVKQLHEMGDQLFESVIVFVKGQMYANALTCPDLEGLEKNFRKVTFYLDTPLVLSLLNLQGEEEFESIAELVSLVKRLEGKVAVFEHTAAELEIVLKGTADNIENPRATGRVVREMRRLGLKKGDVTLKLGNYERALKDLGINIERTPEYREDFQISEEQLELEIEDHLSYRHPRAREFDVNSIRSIFALRRGLTPRRLEDAKAVFVTSNSALSRAAFKFGKAHNSAKEVSVIITDFSLANVAWLKSPMDAPSLPLKETLAACYAAIEPHPKLWEKYLNELERLEEQGTLSADDHALLRVSDVAERALMDLTLGDEEMLRDDSVSSIVKRVKEDLASEHAEKVEKEKSAHDTTRRKLREEVERRYRVEAKIDKAVGRVVNGIYGIVVVVLIGGLFVGMMAGSGFVPPFVAESEVATAVVNTIVLVTVGWGVYSSFIGTSLRTAVDGLRKIIRRRARDKLKEWFM